MQGFQDVKHFIQGLHDAIINLIPTKVSQLTNDAGYKTTDTWNQLEGATSDADGVAGYVPAPKAGDQNKVLHGDGTWSAAGSGTGDVTAVDPGTVTDPVSPYYTKTETDEAIKNNKPDLSGYYTKEEIDGFQTRKEATLLAANWQGTAAPFTYDLGESYKDKAIFIGLNGASATEEQIESATAAQMLGGNGSIIYAFGDKPEIDLSVIILSFKGGTTL